MLFFFNNVWSKAIVLNVNGEGNYIPYPPHYCSPTDSWLQHTQPQPPLRQYVPSSLRSVLFLVLTRILCSKDFNFFVCFKQQRGVRAGHFSQVMKSVPTAVGRKMEGEGVGGRSRQRGGIFREI